METSPVVGPSRFWENNGYMKIVDTSTLNGNTATSTYRLYFDYLS